MRDDSAVPSANFFAAFLYLAGALGSTRLPPPKNLALEDASLS